MGMPHWQVRFAPDEVGQYVARARIRDAHGSYESQEVHFAVTASNSPGRVRVSQQDPRYLEFSNGRPFFPIGQNMAFIGEGQNVTPARVEPILKQLSENGANYLRVWTGCEDWALARQVRKSVWGRSWSWKPPFGHLPTDPTGARYAQLTAGQRESIVSCPFTPSGVAAAHLLRDALLRAD